MAANRIAASKAREKFADVLDEVAVRGERILLERHGKSVAALISAEDLELLEALEDRYDVDLVRRSLADSKERIPWSKVKERLSL
jgi:prevent-host-death family protein